MARSLLSACEADLARLIREAQEAVDVPIRGVISDGQRSLRNAVRTVLPDIPHQLCHFHYLREAAKPVYEADKHAKKELKKHPRGVRPIERTVRASPCKSRNQGLPAIIIHIANSALAEVPGTMLAGTTRVRVQASRGAQ